MINEILVDIRNQLPDVAKIMTENVSLKKKNALLEYRFNDLETKYKELESKNRKLKHKNRLRKDIILALEKKIKYYQKEEKKIKKSTSAQFYSHQIAHGQCSKTDSLDLNINSTTKVIDIPPIPEPTEIILKETIAKPKTRKYTKKKTKETSMIENDDKDEYHSIELDEFNSMFLSIPEDREGFESYKKHKYLPPKSSIQSVLDQLSRMQPNQVPKYISELMCQAHPSILSMKRFFTNVLNTVVVHIYDHANDVNTVHTHMAFFIKLSLLIAPDALKRFKEIVADNTELKSLIIVIESTDPEEEQE